MRSVSPFFLFLVAFSASAECTSSVLFRAGGPINIVHIDNGALYVSLFGERTIQRVAETTSTFFTADATLQYWDIENGTLALPGAPNEVILVAPDGSRRVIAEASGMRGFYLRDGYLYWTTEDRQLRRSGVSGGVVETIAVDLPATAYTIFEDRIVYFDSAGLYWRPLSGGVPLLLLPRSDIAGIGQITRDAILVSTSSPFDPNVASAGVLRVPWLGAPVETVYEASVQGYVPSLSVGAVVAGKTTYIIRTETQHFFWSATSLIVLRDRVARTRFVTGLGSFRVLAADEESITVGQWVDAGGMRRIERICADAPRMRAVR
jgi:hypothetical protein